MKNYLPCRDGWKCTQRRSPPLLTVGFAAARNWPRPSPPASQLLLSCDAALSRLVPPRQPAIAVHPPGLTCILTSHSALRAADSYSSLALPPARPATHATSW